MQIFYDVITLQQYLSNIHSTTVFIPTMGGLHKGHLSLIEKGKKYAEKTIVSIFVNKEQFAAHEDFDVYPQTPDSDIALLEDIGVDILFMPTHEEIYPIEYEFFYDIGSLEHILCGASRPGHFKGVTKVVYRLFDIVKPTYAVFGQKDYQQLTIIKHMVRHFNMSVSILEGETLRNKSGLALSTRNQYLSADELDVANTLNVTLQHITEYDDLTIGVHEIKKRLDTFFDLDYCEVLNAENLGKITPHTTKFIILVAVYLGKVRLIDNMIFTT